jgi:hypothetical protein
LWGSICVAAAFTPTYQFMGFHSLATSILVGETGMLKKGVISPEAVAKMLQDKNNVALQENSDTNANSAKLTNDNFRAGLYMALVPQEASGNSVIQRLLHTEDASVAIIGVKNLKDKVVVTSRSSLYKAGVDYKPAESDPWFKKGANEKLSDCDIYFAAEDMYEKALLIHGKMNDWIEKFEQFEKDERLVGQAATPKTIAAWADDVAFKMGYSINGKDTRQGGVCGAEYVLRAPTTKIAHEAEVVAFYHESECDQTKNGKPFCPEGTTKVVLGGRFPFFKERTPVPNILHSYCLHPNPNLANPEEGVKVGEWALLMSQVFCPDFHHFVSYHDMITSKVEELKKGNDNDKERLKKAGWIKLLETKLKRAHLRHKFLRPTAA